MKFRFCGIVFSLSVICFVSKAQNGKIVEQNLFLVADSIVARLATIDSSARQIANTVNFYHLTYLSDGLKVRGYLAIPKSDRKYPCVIFNRGGSLEFSAITDEIFFRLVGKLAANGYVVVGSQYRGNSGSEGREEFGGSDVNDVLNLIPLLSNLPQADTSRLGMFGWSRGGMETYIALTRTSRIKAAVVGSGLADLKMTLDSRPDMDSGWAQIIPHYSTQKTEKLRERSATYFADKICRTTPILILHGTADWRVSANQVLALVNKFYQIKQPFRFILYEGGQHSLIEHRADYYSQLINWFNYYLRDGKRWPDLNPHGN
jgi:dipeptidyl aminopeptidase/acylaminoacyl peptidase